MLPATRPSLITRLQNGEEGAWRDFAAAYREPILARMVVACHQNGWPTQDAEDFTQDVLMHMPTLVGLYSNEKGSFRAWLTTVLHNRLVDRIRQEKLRRPAAVAKRAPERVQALVETFSSVLVEQFYQVIEDEVRDKVSPREWAIAQALGLDDGRSNIGDPRRSLEEVAQEHGVSRHTASRSLSKVRVLLKEAVNRYLGTALEERS